MCVLSISALTIQACAVRAAAGTLIYELYTAGATAEAFLDSSRFLLWPALCSNGDGYHYYTYILCAREIFRKIPE